MRIDSRRGVEEGVVDFAFSSAVRWARQDMTSFFWKKPGLVLGEPLGVLFFADHLGAAPDGTVLHGVRHRVNDDSLAIDQHLEPSVGDPRPENAFSKSYSVSIEDLPPGACDEEAQDRRWVALIRAGELEAGETLMHFLDESKDVVCLVDRKPLGPRFRDSELGSDHSCPILRTRARLPLFD